MLVFPALHHVMVITRNIDRPKTETTERDAKVQLCQTKIENIFFVVCRHVGRSLLHSVSAVSVRAAKTAYPQAPSSFSPTKHASMGSPYYPSARLRKPGFVRTGFLSYETPTQGVGGSEALKAIDDKKSEFDEVTNYEKREKPRSKCDPSDRRI